MATATILRSWSEGGVTGKERAARLVQLTLSTEGATAGDIPASLFGLDIIEEGSFGGDVSTPDEAVFSFYPVTDGSSLLVGGIAAGAFAAVDASGTFQFVVKGKEA